MSRLKKIKSDYFKRDAGNKFGAQFIIFIQTIWSSQTDGNILILKENCIPKTCSELLFTIS